MSTDGRRARHRGARALALAIAVAAPLAASAAGATAQGRPATQARPSAQGRPATPSRGIPRRPVVQGRTTSWDRAAVTSPARSDALARRPMILPGSTLPWYAAPRSTGWPGTWAGHRVAPRTRAGRFPPPWPAHWPETWWVPFAAPCSPWCWFPLVYVVGPATETAVVRERLVEVPVPGPAATGCATVSLRLGAEDWVVDVALPALGAGTPGGLFVALSRELGAGRQAALRTPDGTRVVLPAGPGVTGLLVEPCPLTP